jgi:Tol biopolymer transport system component/predicted Ser/Thr protein kinase
VKEVFEAALGHLPAERSEFLSQACGGDKSLQSEVESLLSSYEQEKSFMERPVAALAAQSLVKEESAVLLGQQFGRYQIIRELGRGGMGVVYLAQDINLDRHVALKLLPVHLTGDPERLRRFEREARAASALNHPNILTIHEIAQLEGRQFIATEFIDGTTLRERIASKKLTLSEALNIAEQIASALATAHEAGIVHRDIKPENVMLRRDGYVKVLDFGLAKLAEQPAVKVRTASEVGAGANTNTGIMGTVGYMSPEQALGLPVDERTDIFSLGVVIYEMVTGRKPFEVRTLSDVIGISTADKAPANLAEYAPKTPGQLVRIVNRALCKNREERYQAVSNLLADLKSVRSELTQKRGLTARRMILLAAALLLMIGVPVWFYASRKTIKPSLTAMRIFSFTSFTGKEICPAFSPDGKKLAFAWSGERDDNWDIYVKEIEGGAPVRLTANDAAELWPVWSPDGAYIAFSRLNGIDGGIHIIPATGGAERRVYSNWDNEQFPIIDWSPDGRFLALQDRSSPQGPFSVFLLSLETLEERRLTVPPEPHYHGDCAPAFSPDGRTLAFMRYSSAGSQDIYVVPVEGGEPKRLTFDNTLLGGMAWTADGAEIVFTSVRGGADPRLWRISVSGGSPEPLAAGGERASTLAISPQGNLLAYAHDLSGNTKIWRMEISEGRAKAPAKFIASTRSEFNPEYSPDGKRIAFASDRSGSIEIWMCDTDGANPVMLTNFGGPIGGSPHWSPDGRQIAFDSRPEGKSQIFVVGIEGGQPRRVSSGKFDDAVPSWSHDGKWIYFSSNRAGERQIWKMPVDGTNAIQVTGRSGFHAIESPDGQFLYYDVENNGVWTIRRVPVTGGQETFVVKIGKGWPNWTVTANGICFVNEEAKPLHRLEFFTFATGRTTLIATNGNDRGLPGLAVSPDGRWILYTEDEFLLSDDIMLVENFR